MNNHHTIPYHHVMGNFLAFQVERPGCRRPVSLWLPHCQHNTSRSRLCPVPTCLLRATRGRCRRPTCPEGVTHVWGVIRRSPHTYRSCKLDGGGLFNSKCFQLISVYHSCSVNVTEYVVIKDTCNPHLIVEFYYSV